MHRWVIEITQADAHADCFPCPLIFHQADFLDVAVWDMDSHELVAHDQLKTILADDKSRSFNQINEESTGSEGNTNYPRDRHHHTQDAVSEAEYVLGLNGNRMP